MSSNELQTAQTSALPVSVQEVRDQVNLVQHLLREVMREDVHFGKIPGTGNKPALLKPGAEKISLMFRLSTSFTVEHEDLPGGHREYQVICRLHARDGTPVAEGVGVCTTMEGKYRYRWENTGVRVPQEYWETRDDMILGGAGFVARKAWVDDERGGRAQRWMIFHRVDHDNPADYYNTVAKMAKKRAHVDAVLTGTAASDIFEQDIDEPETVPPNDTPQTTPTTPTSADAPKQAPRARTQDADGFVTDGQLRIVRARLKDSGLDEAALLEKFEVDHIESLKKGQVNEVLAYLQGRNGNE